MNPKITILLVEDDPNLSDVLKDYLELLGYKVLLARDGEAGLKTFEKHAIDLCILDVMLPRKDGFTLAADIRKQNIEVPIIFLTARGQMEDPLWLGRLALALALSFISLLFDIATATRLGFPGLRPVLITLVIRTLRGAGALAQPLQ